MSATDDSPTDIQPGWTTIGTACTVAIVSGMLLAPVWVLADVQPLTMHGPPPLPIPTVQETGLPDFTIRTGTLSVPDPVSSPTDSPGPTEPTGDTFPDTVLASRAWGAKAAEESTALGVNPTALAATCLIESGCQNIRGAGSASGAFQMIDSTYTHDINQALAQNPSLADTIDTSLAGKMDGANESIAAAQDLKNAAIALQGNGIANPTFLDARAYYQWGAGAGSGVAKAPDSASMFDTLSSYYTPAQLALNGVSQSTTVGQWRQTIIGKVGSAATQHVLT